MYFIKIIDIVEGRRRTLRKKSFFSLETEQVLSKSHHHHRRNTCCFWLCYLVIIFLQQNQNLFLKTVYFPIFFIRLLCFLMKNKTWEIAFLIYFHSAFCGSTVASIYIARNLRKHWLNDQIQVSRNDKNDVLLYLPFKKNKSKLFVEIERKLTEIMDTFNSTWQKQVNWQMLQYCIC